MSEASEEPAVAELELDYDKEALALFAEAGSRWLDRRPMNPLHRSQQGGTLYVGGEDAAANLQLLSQHGVSYVVNCTTTIPCFHKGKPGMHYLVFDASLFSRPMSHSSDKACAEFLRPLLNFTDSALAAGHSVLVHCKAGAHRAGSTGVLLVMHYRGMGTEEALTFSQRCRPAINPIGSFPRLLDQLGKYPRTADGQFDVNVPRHKVKVAKS